MATQNQVYEEIKQWCRRENINWRWITEYPQELFDDIQLLRRTRCLCWSVWTRSERSQWAGIWGVTTKKKRRIRRKNLIKLAKSNWKKCSI